MNLIRKIQPYLSLLLFFAFHTEGVATPLLERTITLKVQNKPIKEVLREISEQGQFYFSYNTNIINADKRVTISVLSERVRVVLKEILGTNYQFKEKGNYLIIQRLKQDEQIISGYIRDKNTGEKLKNVTVYDKKTLVSATTDSTGYYEIITRKPIEQLSIARVNYSDTSFQLKSIKADTPQYLDISLIPTIEKTPVKVEVDIEDEADKTPKDPYTERTIFSNKDVKKSIRYAISTFERANDGNITEDLKRRWHFSLMPYLGTNLGLSGNVVNDFSLNATVGYSKGNNKIELAGIGNINRKEMKGLQLATIFNVVNGEARGIQASSTINRAKILRGMQISGITNTTDFIRNSVQISGVNNHTDFGQGGVFQVSGLVNGTKNGRTALQIATITNQADTVGVQIGLINNASHLRGLQIGLINKSDTASGVVLGLINIVKKGYHVVEVSSNDITYANIAFKTGTKYFYSIYAFGGNPIINKKPAMLSAGAGFGTYISIIRPIGITLDATIHRFWIDPLLENKGFLLRGTPALNIKFTNRFSLALAPVWNAYYLNTPKQNASDMTYIQKHLIPENAKIEGNWATWWGWQAGMRF